MRRSPWLLPIIATALVLGAGAWRLAHSAAEAARRLRGETVVTQQLVVDRVRAVSQLVTGETTVRDVVVYESSYYGSTKRSLVVVTGRLLAGIALDSGGTSVKIDAAAKRVTVRLPSARLLAVEVTDLRTYDERAGLWNPFRPADRDAIQRLVRERLANSGREIDLVGHANESAKHALEALLGVDGYTVDVSFAGPPILRAAP